MISPGSGGEVDQEPRRILWNQEESSDLSVHLLSSASSYILINMAWRVAIIGRQFSCSSSPPSCWYTMPRSRMSSSL
jgi:hypothetical protein